ncbi:MAG: alpha/beta hydrolase [Pseudomonadota bacterium]|nr:alpha/beta hydrolase [Pseudomonadota bacterium]MDQ3160673.1 alpha/beta hydrolase [Pseudomonadota bacterium]
MHLHRWLAPLLIVAFAACSKPVPEMAGAATKIPAAPTQPGYAAAPCHGDFSFLANTVECGTLVVEETRGSGNGRLVSLPVVRVRALNHPKTDPVIFLHGGPGGGVVKGLAKRLKERRAPITEDRDWIFFDERGTGLSTPSLDCGSLGLSDAGLTSDQAATDAVECGQSLSKQGIDLSRFNTIEIVKDLTDLRKALGVTTYNLYGVSYGARVAMGVMQHDPSGLRAVVLDAPWPPEASWTAPIGPLVSRELRQVLALCAADGACNTRHPALESRLDAMTRKWLESPPSNDKGHRYAAEELAAYLLDALYDDEGARSLPMTLEQIIGGDRSALDEFLVEQSGYTEGQFFTHLCKEEFAFESPSDIQGLQGTDPIAQATARAAKRYFDACKGFDVGAADPVENQPVASDIPTLMLTADIDAGCPPEYALSAATHLGHAQVLNMPNMTHAVASRSPCAKRMIAAFFDQPAATVDATCIANDRPTFPFILYPAPKSG